MIDSPNYSANPSPSWLACLLASLAALSNMSISTYPWPQTPYSVALTLQHMTRVALRPFHAFVLFTFVRIYLHWLAFVRFYYLGTREVGGVQTVYAFVRICSHLFAFVRICPLGKRDDGAEQILDWLKLRTRNVSISNHPSLPMTPYVVAQLDKKVQLRKK
jgi:hypothetical protein